MSVSRTTVRLIATCVASGALVGMAAMPALADGGSHDRDNGGSYSRSHRPGDNWGDHHGDRNRGWYGDRYRDHRHLPYGDRDRFGDWILGWGLQHGWHGDLHHGHNHYPGRR
ncbi:hypothetical protein ACWCP6_25445 [Streptomyces sp. NPDC002004]